MVLPSSRKKSKSVSRRRSSTKNKLSLESQCRICLDQCSDHSVSLDDPLSEDDENSKPLVFEALELLVKETVPRGPEYPERVCEVCAGYLDSAYELIIQYRKSKASILEQLKKSGKEFSNGSLLDAAKQNLPESKAPVEIVIGTEKYDIKDLLIVEEDDDEPGAYDGFLQNLGISVSATFVEKGHQKQKPTIDSKTPSLEIKEVKEENLCDTEEFELTHADEDNNEDIKDFLHKPSSDLIDNKITPNGNINYECPYCLVPLSTSSRFKLHISGCTKRPLTITKDEAENTTRKKHKCKICGETFRLPGSLYYHSKKHKGKQFSCKECGKTFFTGAQARRHSSEVHNKQRTVKMCQICGKGFHYHSGLYYHMKMHGNIRDLLCRYCPRKFYTQTAIKRHEMTHTGERPFPCDFCDKRFCSQGERNKHHFLHSDDRPYPCKYCPLGYTTPYSLKVHMTNHSGIWKCEHCGNGFMDNDILQFHLKTKHKESSEEVQEEDDGEEQVDGNFYQYFDEADDIGEA